MSSLERKPFELTPTHSLHLSDETNRNADITKELLREEETLTLEELLVEVFGRKPKDK